MARPWIVPGPVSFAAGFQIVPAEIRAHAMLRYQILFQISCLRLSHPRGARLAPLVLKSQRPFSPYPGIKKDCGILGTARLNDWNRSPNSRLNFWHFQTPARDQKRLWHTWNCQAERSESLS